MGEARQAAKNHHGEDQRCQREQPTGDCAAGRARRAVCGCLGERHHRAAPNRRLVASRVPVEPSVVPLGGAGLTSRLWENFIDFLMIYRWVYKTITAPLEGCRDYAEAGDASSAMRASCMGCPVGEPGIRTTACERNWQETRVALMTETANLPAQAESPEAALVAAQLAATPARPGDGPAVAPRGDATVPTSAAGELQTIGYVREADGKAVIIRLNGPQVSSEAGTRLQEGDIIATQPGAKLELQFVDGTSIFLSGPARMLVQQYLYDIQGKSAVTFFVIEGVFAVSAGTIGTPGHGTISVRTPVATVSLRGGRLLGKAAAETEQNTFTLVKNLDGTVGTLVVATTGAPITLNLANQTTRAVSLFRPAEKPAVLTLEQIEPQFGTSVLVWLALYPNQQQALKDLAAGDAIGAIAVTAASDNALGNIVTSSGGGTAGRGGNGSGALIPELRTRSDAGLLVSGLFSKLVSVTLDLLLVGDADSNSIVGSFGNDILRGDGGDDELNGGDGDDVLDGGTGNDVVRGGAGSDLLIGGSGEGDDTLDGGSGIDTVTFVSQDATQPIVVDLSDPTNRFATGTATGNDVLIEIENVIGGGGGDSITGSEANNTLQGGDGDDVLDGRGGDDRLDGGAGSDTASFASNASPVTASLLTGLAFGNQSGSDVLFSIENLIGGTGADAFTGSTGANLLSGNGSADTLSGGAGDDTLNGGDGSDLLFGGLGADILNGGAGADRLFYSSPTEGGDQVAAFVSGSDSFVLLSSPSAMWRP
ncbi:MAG: hypothetical protein EXQ96_05425 [Alphaproteobacteria bacterium]|nr:hypothetical protein [Alphaproteobacteria bacterium]